MFEKKRIYSLWVKVTGKQKLKKKNISNILYFNVGP
jgi:hypothetical protein